MAEEANSNYRIKVKIGDAEFEAEGSESAVRAQYDQFMKMLSATLVPKRETPANDRSNGSDEPDGDIQPDVIRRVFSTDRENLVSLRMLPHSENPECDALIMLLWGFAELRGQPDVFATRLMAAARQSGLQIDRVDRVLLTQPEFYRRAGQRRGTKYSLNNRGIAHAKRLVREVVE